MTTRNPVYCAIWFGMTLLGTAGLFLFQGAQFLAVATVVVYAGAILVTFLFVLMLAQPDGRAHLRPRELGGAALGRAGGVIVGVLTLTWSVLSAAPVTDARRTAGRPPANVWPTSTWPTCGGSCSVRTCRRGGGRHAALAGRGRWTGRRKQCVLPRRNAGLGERRACPIRLTEHGCRT